MISKGTEYMLRHHMYQRLSNGAPISAHITDIMYPQAYMLSAVDLVYIAGEADLWTDSRTQELMELLRCKFCEYGGCKIESIYIQKGYKAFDTRRKTSDWISYIFQQEGL